MYNNVKQSYSKRIIFPRLPFNVRLSQVACWHELKTCTWILLLHIHYVYCIPTYLQQFSCRLCMFVKGACVRHWVANACMYAVCIRSISRRGQNLQIRLVVRKVICLTILWKMTKKTACNPHLCVFIAAKGTIWVELRLD